MSRLWLAGGWSGANFDQVTVQSAQLSDRLIALGHSEEDARHSEEEPRHCETKLMPSAEAGPTLWKSWVLPALQPLGATVEIISKRQSSSIAGMARRWSNVALRGRQMHGRSFCRLPSGSWNSDAAQSGAEPQTHLL